MKSTDRINLFYMFLWFYFVLFLVLSLNTSKAALPEVQSDSNLSCMMGGVGLDESKAMREEAKKWPLVIEFTEQQGKSYAWISGAELQIINTKGETIFYEQCNGPMFLGKLVPGRYELLATYQNQTKKRTITIDGKQSVKVSFIWGPKTK